jgi:hypothetical protein
MYMDNELPWWTEEELQGAAAIDEIYLADQPPPIVDRKLPLQADKINWTYDIFKKYKMRTAINK